MLLYFLQPSGPLHSLWSSANFFRSSTFLARSRSTFRAEWPLTLASHNLLRMLLVVTQRFNSILKSVEVLNGSFLAILLIYYSMISFQSGFPSSASCFLGFKSIRDHIFWTSPTIFKISHYFFSSFWSFFLFNFFQFQRSDVHGPFLMILFLFFIFFLIYFIC